MLECADIRISQHIGENKPLEMCTHINLEQCGLSLHLRLFHKQWGVAGLHCLPKEIGAACFAEPGKLSSAKFIILILGWKNTSERGAVG